MATDAKTGQVIFGGATAVGLRSVGSYQVSGVPYVTGGVIKDGEELKIQLAKVAEVTHRIQHETEQKLNLFEKEQSIINKIYHPLKVIRGKK